MANKRYNETGFDLNAGVYLKAPTMKEWQLTQTAIETNGKRYYLSDIARVKHDVPANKMLQGVVQIFMKDGKFHTLGYAFSQKEKAAKAVEYICGVVNGEIDISQIPVDKGKVKKKRKGLKILLIILAIFVGAAIIGSIFGKKPVTTTSTGSSKPVVTQSPKEKAEVANESTEKLINPYNITIFREGTCYGLKKDGQVISDPVWSSIYEVIEGDLVYYVVAYFDKARGNALREEYDTSIVDYDEFYGVVDSNGNIVVEPQYSIIRAGPRTVETDQGTRRYVPFESEYIVATDWVDNGKITNYVTLGSGEKTSKKNRDRVDYLIHKGTWEVAFDLGEYNFTAFHDDYIEFETAYNQGGIYSISQRKQIVYVEQSKGRWIYYPGIGFTAGHSTDGAKNIFISFNGTVIESESGKEIIVDQEHKLILAQMKLGLSPYGNHKPYKAYNPDGSPLGGGVTMDAPYVDSYHQNPTLTYVLESGDWIQLVHNSQGEIALLNLNTKQLTSIPGATEPGKWREGYCPVANAEGKWGYINEKGEFLFSFQFDKAENFKDGKASVTKNYKIHTVDTNGNID